MSYAPGHNVTSNGKTTPRVTMLNVVKTMAKMPMAFAKAVTGQDEFSKQLRREYAANKKAGKIK